jgi:hypothetical protein
MADRKRSSRYRSTESKYKGGAAEMYVTYDLAQQTRGGGTAVYPKVKRAYVAGDVKDWQAGDFTKRTGKGAHGVKIEYEQTRSGYQRKGFTATRGGTTYRVPPTKVQPTAQTFSQIVEVPEAARNVQFHAGALPEHYRAALPSVR